VAPHAGGGGGQREHRRRIAGDARVERLDDPPHSPAVDDRQLEPRVRRILQLRFALAGRDPLTSDEIGERLGLSAERSRQLAADGLRRLRAPAERAALAA
jgi:DNA-directed RNA polymerase sigma subunit (sigma70/sigma32)